jgi:DNA polymerase-3 subunit alpha
VQPDRFSGGLRLDVAQVWDLAAARARFGRYLAVAVDGAACRRWPSCCASGRRASCTPSTASSSRAWACGCSCNAPSLAELDLGDEARFWPSDEALARWRSLAARGEVVYEWPGRLRDG